MSNHSSGAAKLRLIGSPAAVQESRFEAIFEHASDAIVTLSAAGISSGEIDGINAAAHDLTGFSASELVGQTVEVLVPSAQIPDRSRALSAALLREPGTYEDVAIKRKDGFVRLVDLSVRHPRTQEGANFTMILMRDVTEKRKLERELVAKHGELLNAYTQLEKKNAELHAAQEVLVQAGKMAALGELAAGVAHELNQPLTGIKGYAQELQAVALPVLANTPVSGEASFSVKEIISNADKMSTIIGYLRSFVRKSTVGFETTSVHHAIEEALKMLSKQFSSRGIKVEKSFDQTLPEIYANPLQLEQVFINLSTNARDAIEAKGKGDGVIKIETRASGPFVEIRFTDNGSGMSEKTKSKIFNPFFTTKEVGKGMGLGMSLSFGILSKIQGSIVAESELGKGTTFIIRIPRDFRELG